MTAVHPLLGASVKGAIERAASRHRGRAWVSSSFTDLNDRASHPCGILHGEPFSVFAKLGLDDEAGERFRAELNGLALVRDRVQVATPTPIGTGLVALDRGFVLLTEALSERPPEHRTRNDWRSIGRTLATLHQVRGARFGLEDFDGFFGPLRQANAPVASNRWADFYGERRLRTPRDRLGADGLLPSRAGRRL